METTGRFSDCSTDEESETEVIINVGELILQELQKLTQILSKNHKETTDLLNLILQNVLPPSSQAPTKRNNNEDFKEDNESREAEVGHEIGEDFNEDEEGEGEVNLPPISLASHPIGQ
jgi:hypothetical protein